MKYCIYILELANYRANGECNWGDAEGLVEYICGTLNLVLLKVIWGYSARVF